jgi:hypothetical protein
LAIFVASSDPADEDDEDYDEARRESLRSNTERNRKKTLHKK